MAVAIIIIATLSIIATVMAVLALIPVIDELGSDTDPEGHWEEVQAKADAGDTFAQSAITSRDRAFQSILVLPIFLIGAIIAWAFLAVTRRDFGEI